MQVFTFCEENYANSTGTTLSEIEQRVSEVLSRPQRALTKRHV